MEVDSTADTSLLAKNHSAVSWLYGMATSFDQLVSLPPLSQVTIGLPWNFVEICGLHNINPDTADPLSAEHTDLCFTLKKIPVGVNEL